MDNTLTTARAARLLGLTLIIWAVSETLARQVYVHIQVKELEASLGADNPLVQNHSLFVAAPSLIAPVSTLITGIVLLLSSRAIQKMLR
jgi:hypothetical protein